jgi:hypothetical protein
LSAFGLADAAGLFSFFALSVELLVLEDESFFGAIG